MPGTTISLKNFVYFYTFPNLALFASAMPVSIPSRNFDDLCQLFPSLANRPDEVNMLNKTKCGTP